MAIFALLAKICRALAEGEKQGVQKRRIRRYAKLSRFNNSLPLSVVTFNFENAVLFPIAGAR
jgi:hypothetical protein